MKRVSSFLLTLILVFVTVFTALPPTTAKAAESSRYSVLVLDVSGTETFTSGFVQIYKADTAVEYVKTAAHSFLEDILNAKGNNYVALITYTTDAVVVSDFTDDYDTLSKRVDAIEKTDVTDRNIAAGLSRANDLLESVTDVNATKNVILFTTGMTDDGDHEATGRYDSGTIGSNWYRSDTGIKLYQYANVAYNTASTVKQNATLYTLGLFQTMEQIPQKGKDIAEFFKLTAKDLATSESCFFDVSDPAELEFAFGEIAGDINTRSGFFKYAGMIDKDKDSLGEYWYSDRYFFKRASLRNPSLATMSLCLELSCWSSHEKDAWYDPASPNSLNDKLVNAKTLLMGDPAKGEGYEGLGFDHFSANEGWYKEPTNDSIGVCLARKQIYRNEKSKTDPYTLIAVAVRGGGYYSEWAGNFKIGEEGNHQGFATASETVLNFLADYIRGLGAEESKNLKLWIVGYSRGGAVANMTAGAICDNPNRFEYPVDQENLYCYTFEAPQGALKNHMNGTYYSIHNILNANDIVPMVAPSAWGFARYNYGNTRYLPTLLTTDPETFQKQLEAMKKELESLGFDSDALKKKGIDFSYQISELCKVEEIRIDTSKFLPGGDPLWWTEESEAPTHVVLRDGVDFLAEDLIGDRAFYVEYLQYCLSEVLGILNHYRGIAGGLGAYGESLVDMEAFKKNLVAFFELESLMDTLSPMFSLNPFYTYEERLEDVEAKAMKKLGSIFQAYAEIKGLGSGICEILTNLVKEVGKDIWNNNLDSVNTINKFVHIMIENTFQPHYPEICLAWCRSLDSNYITDIAQDKNSAVTRVVRINCPVNVGVYDKNDKLVAAIVNDTVSVGNLLMAYVSQDGEKIFYLPGDSEYRIQIEAREDCNVSYSVAEFNFVHSQYVKMENYYDLELKVGDELEAQIGAAKEDSLKSNAISGTDATYKLIHNNRQVYSDESYTGEDGYASKYGVTVKTEGNGGYANGSGRYLRGGYAEAQAYPLTGCEFLGWYDEAGTLLSAEPSFRFAVRGDTTLVAKFSEASINEVRFTAKKGGSITAPAGYYPENTKLGIIAIPDEGYTFKGWKTDAGEFLDASAKETEFIMPGSGANVTAIFEAIGDDASSDFAEEDGGSFGPTVVVISILAFLVIGGGLLLFLMIKCRNKLAK